jgi:hypothetical protein
MKTEIQRRTDRVNIKVPVRVSAVDAAGQKLSEQGHTLTISRYGATIVLNRNLVPGLRLTIGTSSGESSALVLGQIGGQSGVHVYGIAFLEPSANLWGIHFPPLTDSEKGLVRLLLQCSVCKTCEVVHLNELETDVFDGNHNLPRSCSQCDTWTIWLQTPNELPDQQSGAQSKILPESSRTPKKRKHVRVQVKMKAYIRHAGFEDEIVNVHDVSRGGFSFVSSKEYIVGSRIEVTVPYSGGKSNIFVASRINRVQDLAGKGLKMYGAHYIQSG